MNIPEATFISALALSSPLWLAVLIGKIRTRQEAKENLIHDTIENVMRQAYDWGYAEGHLEAVMEQDPNYQIKTSPFDYWDIGYNDLSPIGQKTKHQLNKGTKTK